jgi:hypothetical protein
MAFASPALLANGVGWTTATSGDYVQGTFGPGDTPNGGTALRINGINNPTASGTYFAEIDAYSDTGCSTLVETGVVAFDIHNYTVLSAAVDPSLGFTVANRATTCNGESNLLSSAGNSTGVAFGRITLSTNVSGAQALTVTGNSAGGFSVYIRGMQTTTNMRNAGHNWADVAGTYPTGALIGSGERFGYTYNDSTTSSNVTNPASANFIKLDSTDRTIMGSTTSSSGTGCVTFAAQTDAVTPAGAYDATVIYTVVPTY